MGQDPRLDRQEDASAVETRSVDRGASAIFRRVREYPAPILR
jgi:hypothetical protein